MSYGEKLKRLRCDKSQAEVAKAVNISESAYAMYEREERMPRDKTKIALAEYFNTSVQYIFFDK